MSPEQAEGQAGRSASDIFSLGVDAVRDGDRRAAVQGRHARVDPLRDPQGHADAGDRDEPELPRDLARIVERCLAKDPERRYQTAKDLRNDFGRSRGPRQRRVRTRSGGDAVRWESQRGAGAGGWSQAPALLGHDSRPWPRRGRVGRRRRLWRDAFRHETHQTTTGVSHVTVAVLPFENFSSDPERDYLSDGIAEETIAALGQVDPGIGASRATSTLLIVDKKVDCPDWSGARSRVHG